MTLSLAAQPASKRPRARHWHGVLAAMISLALVLSLFHCCCLDADESTLTVAVAQTSCDIAGTSGTAAPAPHCCHCLAHVTTVAPQDGAVAIEYVSRIVGLAIALAPEAADLASPFKPPRA
jgi:hypothetical protein